MAGRKSKKAPVVQRPETTPHPVLDRSARLRAKADAFGLTCPDTEWVGWHSRYRFVCHQGHEFSMGIVNLVDSFRQCPVCRTGEAMDRLVQRAAAAQITCLDNEWRGIDALYRFRCSEGHEWSETPKHLHCRTCSSAANRERRRLQDGLARLQGLAEERGGAFLSGAYLGHARRHRFRCAEGHEWDTTASNVLRGSWCGTCSDERKRTDYRNVDGLEQLQRAARANGGECLSESYLGGKRSYRFRCSAAHEWETQGVHVLKGGWCPQCAYVHKKQSYLLADGLQRLQQLAAARGGLCLSDAYKGSKGIHRFRCGRGHEWETSALVMFQQGWCPECSDDSRRLGIEVAQAAARARGGECLSQSYANLKTKMTWMCDRGHVWETSFQVIRRGGWCPQCAHMARITSRNSKAIRRYVVKGTLPEPAGA